MQKEKTGSKIKPSTSNLVFNILAYSLVAIVSIVCVLPFLLVVSGSFTDNGVIVREGYSLWPKVFSLEAYKVIFKNPASILQAYKMTINKDKDDGIRTQEAMKLTLNETARH